MTAADLFDQAYFNGGGKVGGYAREGLWDYPVHHLTAAKILEHRPTSVLEVGCARGYLLHRVKAAGIPAQGLEVSRHCYLTRTTNAVRNWDVCDTPWPIADKSVDLCYSVAVLEHIPADKILAVLAEMARVSKRGIHGIDIHDDDGFDKTHFTIRPLEWWAERMPTGQVAVDKEDLERGPVMVPTGSGVKLNLGSYTTMFHHGWINVDRHDLGAWARHHAYRYVQHDLSRGLWLDDNTADLIYSSHTLEHFDFAQGAELLRDWHRALKSGGVCRVIVPDAAHLTMMAQLGALGAFDEVSPTAAAHTSQAGKLWELLCGGDHRAAYDAEGLTAAFRAAGFASVTVMPVFVSASPVMQRETWDMFPDLSLVVEGVK